LNARPPGGSVAPLICPEHQVPEGRRDAEVLVRLRVVMRYVLAPAAVSSSSIRPRWMK
jgi:hypothetical protein